MLLLLLLLLLDVSKWLNKYGIGWDGDIVDANVSNVWFDCWKKLFANEDAPMTELYANCFWLDNELDELDDEDDDDDEDGEDTDDDEWCELKLFIIVSFLLFVYWLFENCCWYGCVWW